MKSWKRITLVVFVLIGGTMSFAYWSINQFDSAFDNLSAISIADVPPVHRQKMNFASTSLEVEAEFATSSDLKSASTSGETVAVLATSTDVHLSFTFPKKNSRIYIGCTYPISWDSSTTIHSLETALVDAGNGKPIASKLAKENTIGESQNLSWKVGFAWPGRYYIEVLKINGIRENSKVVFLK